MGASLAFALHPFAKGVLKYTSPDGRLVATIIPTGKGKSLRDYECRIEIRQKRGRSLLKHDFSSSDGEHGYGIVRAEWTPDSQFFVFSVESSGGHQPWHYPTLFYDRQRNFLKVLDDSVGPITSPDFKLVGSNALETETQEGSITIKLEEVAAAARNAAPAPAEQ